MEIEIRDDGPIPIHVMPRDGTDFMDHVESPLCWCNPDREMKPEYIRAIYIHKKAKDNLQ